MKIVLVFYFGESEELQTGGKMSGRFAEFSTSVDEFICEQKNKNTSKKTIQDVGLFRKFLETKSEEREVEMIDAPTLNEYLSEFVVVVRFQKSNNFPRSRKK